MAFFRNNNKQTNLIHAWEEQLDWVILLFVIVVAPLLPTFAHIYIVCNVDKVPLSERKKKRTKKNESRYLARPLHLGHSGDTHTLSHTKRRILLFLLLSSDYTPLILIASVDSCSNCRVLVVAWGTNNTNNSQKKSIYVERIDDNSLNDNSFRLASFTPIYWLKGALFTQTYFYIDSLSW